MVAGGYGTAGTLASCELYDPVSGTWSVTGSLSIGSFGHTETLVPNGKVLVAGGGFLGRAAELYDPATGTWTLTGNLNTIQSGGATTTVLPNGKLLLAGGTSDPATSAEL